MYDDFSQDYDRFVNWPSRLAYELPFIEARLQHLQAELGRPPRVLDAACGTGQHALALAGRGYPVAGADLSAGMIARARQNAASAGMEVPFQVAGFGELADIFGPGSFDALLCLGNSLPHAASPVQLAVALSDFARLLVPGGLLLVQNRNFDAVLAAQQRWMGPEAHQEGAEEWVFVRFYDFEPGGLIRFNILTLHRSAGSGWTQRVTATLLRPLPQAELAGALASAGFIQPAFYGDLSGAAFDPAASPNLIVTARGPDRA